MPLDHVATLADGGGSRSAISRAWFALRFVETSGGIRKEHQLANSPLTISAVKEFELGVGGGATRAVKKAPQVPVSFLLLFEHMVVDVEAPVFVRMYAWSR